jgi:hypothetical protein
MIEQAGLRIIAQKRVRISREQAETFYAVHRERPFFGELVDFMISGPVVVQVLEGENAIAKYRDIMGATDPPRRRRERSARPMRSRYARIRCTVPMRPTRRSRKSPSSFQATRSSGKDAAAPAAGSHAGQPMGFACRLARPGRAAHNGRQQTGKSERNIRWVRWDK